MSGLFDNLPLKAVSLGIAVVLWFVIAGEKTSERGLAVPVELQNVPSNLEMTGEALNYGGGAPARFARHHPRPRAPARSPPRWTWPEAGKESASST